MDDLTLYANRRGSLAFSLDGETYHLPGGRIVGEEGLNPRAWVEIDVEGAEIDDDTARRMIAAIAAENSRADAAAKIAAFDAEIARKAAAYAASVEARRQRREDARFARSLRSIFRLLGQMGV